MRNNIFLFIVYIFISINLFSYTAIDFYNIAYQAYVEENYDLAIENLKKSLELNENYNEAIFLLADIYYIQENYEYAYIYINKLLKYDAKNVKYIIFQCNVEIKLKRYDIAEKKLKEIINKDPLNVDAYNSLVTLYFETDKKILARETLLNILKFDGNNSEALLKLALYYEKENPKLSEEYYIKNTNANSLNSKIFYHYSIFLFNNRRFNEALTNINIALDIKKKIEYQKIKAKYLLYLKRIDEAIALIKDLLPYYKNDHILYYMLGYGYYLVNDYNSSVNALNKAVSLRKDDEFSNYLLDMVLVEKFPVTEKLRINRSLFYYETAIQAKKDSELDIYLYNIRKAILLNPNNSQARLEFANYYKNAKFPERFFKELLVIYRINNDKNIKDIIDMESRYLDYRLGNSWGINQYNLVLPEQRIPLFFKSNIQNIHFNSEIIYSKILENLSYTKNNYDIILYSDKDYSVTEKINIARNQESLYYFDLELTELNNSINVVLYVYNSKNSDLIAKYETFQIGNNRLIITANSILRKVDPNIQQLGEILKIAGDRALINLGRKDNLKLKDFVYILQNKKYSLQANEFKLIIEKSDIKGTGIVTKVDENIAEIKFKNNDFFKDIDVGDYVYLIRK